MKGGDLPFLSEVFNERAKREGEPFMGCLDIRTAILVKLQDDKTHSISDLAREMSSGRIYESDVRSAVLGLVRRNQVELTDDFKIRRATDGNAG